MGRLAVSRSSLLCAPALHVRQYVAWQEQAKATLVQSREGWQAQDARMKQRIEQLVKENAALQAAVYQRGVV